MEKAEVGVEYILKHIVYIYENILINPVLIKVKKKTKNQRPEIERLDIKIENNFLFLKCSIQGRPRKILFLGFPPIVCSSKG